MKSISLTTSLVSLLFAGSAWATSITINWQTLPTPIGSGYLAKVATDSLQNVAVIAESGKGLSPLENQVGTYRALTTPASIGWAGTFSDMFSPAGVSQIGHAPAIAFALIAGYPSYNNAVEVHQGGQEDGSSLWFQLGSHNAGSTAGINWGPSNLYDTGFNPTVAIDLNGPNPNSMTVVEVHQAANSVSALWYHVGTLTLGASPSMSSNWSNPFQVNSGLNLGKLPTVSVSNNVAVLMAEGDNGALWYSIGVINMDYGTINWSAPIPYSTVGYNPTVSLFAHGTGFPGSRVVVEAHQADNSTGQLTYRTGVLYNGASGAAPTSITWTTDTDNPYATGCYPSLAVNFYGYDASNLSVTEVHGTECGAVSTQQYSFGYLVK
jgi:hypothetical protein